MGKDVVIVLDGITRLARAYNLVGAHVGPDHVGRCRLHRAVPAEEVLRRGAQRRGGRLAHDHRHRADRDRQPDGRGDLRGVQGHRQHGAAARPAAGRAADLPGHRRRGVEHPPRGAALRPSASSSRSGSCAGCSNALEDGATGLELLIDKIRTTKTTTSSWPRSPRRPALTRSRRCGPSGHDMAVRRG